MQYQTVNGSIFLLIKSQGEIQWKPLNGITDNVISWFYDHLNKVQNTAKYSSSCMARVGYYYYSIGVVCPKVIT
jgi:hypothetical protein